MRAPADTAQRTDATIDAHDARFDPTSIHHALEALGTYAGIVPERLVRVPERDLAWIDASFGGTLSLDVAASSAWIASDAAGPLGFVAFDGRGLRSAFARRWEGSGATGLLGPVGFMRRTHPEVRSALLRAAVYSLRERGYRRAVALASNAAELAFFELEAGAVADRAVEPAARRYRTTVLASGAGTNFEAVAAAAARGELPLELTAVLAGRAGAGVLARAEAAGVPAVTHLWERSSVSREAFDRTLQAEVAAREPELVLLLGWMHVLPGSFVEAFPEALNLHPAYLPLEPAADEVTYPDGSSGPARRGPRAVDDALAAGGRWSGATLHRLGVAVDRGRVMARAPLSLVPDQPRELLLQRLHALERRVVRDGILRWADERSP